MFQSRNTFVEEMWGVHLFYILLFLDHGHGRPIWSRSSCDLPAHILNDLFGKTVDEAGFGVEPAVGLGLQEGENSGAAINAVLKAVLEKNSTYSMERLKPCVEAYLGLQPSPPFPGSNVPKPPGGFIYFPPWYLGGTTSVGVPIPDDEEYRPGSEGYTTYINPHFFMKKVQTYKPAAFLHYNNVYKLLYDAYDKLTSGLGQVFEDYTQDIGLNESAFLEDWY